MATRDMYSRERANQAAPLRHVPYTLVNNLSEEDFDRSSDLIDAKCPN